MCGTSGVSFDHLPVGAWVLFPQLQQLDAEILPVFEIRYFPAALGGCLPETALNGLAFDKIYNTHIAAV